MDKYKELIERLRAEADILDDEYKRFKQAELYDEAADAIEELLQRVEGAGSVGNPESEGRAAESAQNVPNDELISKKAAIDAVRSFYDESDVGVKSIEERIEDLPAAQPMIGKWVWSSSTYDRTPCEMRFWCDQCHHEVITHNAPPWEKYCPNCGAKMKEDT